MATQTHSLNLNQIYFFAFNSDLSSLNGLYTVQAILQSDEVEALLDDPIMHLYQTVNKLDEYEEGLYEAKYRYEVFYKLQTIEEPKKVYFIPDSLILPNPSQDFKEMMEYLLTVQIGIIDEPTELDMIAIEICNKCREVIGITPVITTSTYGKKYVPEQIVKDLIKSRNIIRKTTTTDSIIRSLQDELALAKEKIAKYETIIVEYEQFKDKIRGMIMSN